MSESTSTHPLSRRYDAPKNDLLIARWIVGIVLGTVTALVLLANLRIPTTNRKAAIKHRP